MPFIKRRVDPENLCRENPLLTSIDVLEDQNKFIWTNMIKQLGSLGDHFNDILNEINKNFDQLDQRSGLTCDKLQKLVSEFENAKVKPLTFSHLTDGTNQTAFSMTPKIYHITPVMSNMSESLKNAYASCQPSPNLSLLDPLRTDGITTMKLYSDPQFFFNSWADAFDKNLKEKMNRRKKNVKTTDQKRIADLPKTRKAEIVNKNADLVSGNKKMRLAGADSQVSEKEIQRETSVEVTYRQPLNVPEPPSDSTFGVSSSQAPSVPPLSSKSSIVTNRGNFSEPPPPPMAKQVREIKDNEKAPPSFTPAYAQIPENIESSANLSVAAPPPPPSAPPPPPVVNIPVTTSASQSYASDIKQKSTPKPNLPPADDPRDSLLSSIRTGKSLKKVEDVPVQQKQNDEYAYLNNIADILSKKFEKAQGFGSDDEEEELKDDWD